MIALLRGVWAYRYFILSSIRNDLVIRFYRSRLGATWMIIHPLVMVAIYAFILSAVLGARLPDIEHRYSYAIYLTAGILAWTLFSDVVSRCLNLFIENGNLLKKIVFPKVALPLIAVGSALVHNLFLFAAILGVFAILGFWPGVTILWVPVLTVITVMLATGVGLVVGAMNVFMRDLGQVVPVVLQLAFWFTPILYPIQIVPEPVRDLLALNPLVPLVGSYHHVLVFKTSPDLTTLLGLSLAGCVTLFVGLIVVRRASSEMVDVL
jgi:lipopolysaccharide transport system permease protein